MRGRFFWRVGFFLALLFVFTVGACTLLFWFIATSLGLIQLPEHLPGLPPFGTGRLFFLPLWGIIPILLVLVGLATAARALRGATMPIGDLMEAAGRVAAGDYAARVPERGPSELRSLANAFNEMTTRLQLNDEQRRKLLADISHELRTPLTVIQGNLEGLMDGVYPRDDAHLAAILEETRLLSRLIEDLRTLALADAGALKLQKMPTDAAALINETLNSFRPQADTAEFSCRRKLQRTCPRSNWIRRAFGKCWKISLPTRCISRRGAE